MDAIEIINKYYDKNSEVYSILLNHSQLVAQKAVFMAQNHPELNIDIRFVSEAAMLHDIGIFLTHAPGIGCFGMYPYICHGFLGAEIVQSEGFPLHALVCERHTGTGLSVEDIQQINKGIPLRDMRPQSVEEQLICFADKFFSKSKPSKEKSVDSIRTSISKYGQHHTDRFDAWCRLFL